ncbi:2-methylcitrate synthase [Photobacterium ganghwense]|uniref:bifunctional 2-methylcitrate synthase/citrate synthase n=1 Tax=Photobacterium ganghwense TaxID=320778 RepID=UPI0039EF725D
MPQSRKSDAQHAESHKLDPKKPLGGEGLRGQTAGSTALCTVGKTGTGLTYRGYDISDLATKAEFEEVAFLLLKGKLPNRAELAKYKNTLVAYRGLPMALKTVLEAIPATAHPMDVMRTGCSVLGNLEQEHDFSEEHDKADRLLALLPAIICYWYRYSHHGVRIETYNDQSSLGGFFLHMLTGTPPSDMFKQAMNCSLILYAEHEFNASTFAARVCASTLSDIHSCVCAAIGTLRGPLHGGANEAAMDMIEQWQSPDEAEQGILKKLANKEKVMGFGHAIYREADPRNALIKVWAEKLSKDAHDPVLYDISVRVEEVMKREKNLFCNADFFHAPAYHFMEIPTKLFTPIFVMSRVTGWAAHVFEQRAHNRIIRPSADYIGPPPRDWVAIEDRH